MADCPLPWPMDLSTAAIRISGSDSALAKQTAKIAEITNAGYRV